MAPLFKLGKKKAKNYFYQGDKNKKLKRNKKDTKQTTRTTLSVILTPELKQYCKDQKVLFGSMSEFIRHLIFLDMRGLLKPPEPKIVYQMPEITYKKEEITMRPPTKPKVPSQPPSMPLGQSYGGNHAELMSELKSVLKKRTSSTE